MAKVGTVLIELDANVAKLIDGVKKSNRKISALHKQVNTLQTSLKNLALGAVGIYSLDKAFDTLRSTLTGVLDAGSELEQYKNRMSAFTNSSKEMNQELAKATKFALDYNQAIDKTTDTLLLMKNYGLKDGVKELKMYTNTALGSGKSIDQFAEAMADGLVGEFERLKEFGVKASAQGDKVAFHWSDSSGKSRDVVIQNNKEIIDSTLYAIFNEKYLGQGELFKNSWAGITQSLSNSWTIFNQNVAGAGLQEYMSSLGQVINKEVKEGLLGTASVSSAFSSVAVDGIKMIIKSFGVLIDTVSLLKGGFDLVLSGFEYMAGGIMEGINYLHKGWSHFTDDMSRIWTGMANTVKKIFAGVVNGVIKGLNFVIDKINALSGWAGKSKIFDKIEEMKADIKPPKPTDYEPVKPIIDEKYIKDMYKSAKQSFDDYKKEVEKGFAGDKFSTKLLTEIDKISAGTKNGTDKLKAEKEKAKQVLDDIVKNTLTLNNSTAKTSKKASSNAKKALSDATALYKEYLKLTNQTEKLKEIGNKETLNKFIKAGYGKTQIAELKKALGKVNKEVTLDFATQFNNMFDSLLKGDIAGAISGLFNGISQDLLAQPIKALSDKLGGMTKSLFSGFGGSDDGMFSGLFGQALGGLALGGIGSLLGNVLDGWLNKEETPPELESIHLTSESMANALDFIKNAQNPLLSYTKKQTEYLEIIASSFGNVGNNLLASGIDFGGQFYQGTSKGGFFSSKNYELYGTDVNFEAIKMADAMAGNFRAYSDTVIKKTYKSWFKKKTTYFTSTKDISDLIAQDMANATNAIFSSLIDSSSLLGIGIDINKLLSESLDVGKIDTTGMTGTGIAEEIEKRYSAEMDRIIGDFFGDALYEFQKSGEGLAETLSRVSVTFEQTADLLGQVGKQINWQNANYLVDAAGGMDEFNSLWNSYIDNFYSDAEKWAMKQKSLAADFASLGVQMPKTDEAYRQLIESFKVTDKESAKTYASLLSLGDAFGEFTKGAEESVKKLSDLWLGEKSPLTIAQKKLYASYNYMNKPSTMTAEDNLNTAYKYARVEEDYRVAFYKYDRELRKENNVSLNDVVFAIKDTNVKLDELSSSQDDTNSVSLEEFNELKTQTQVLRDLILEIRNASRIR